MITPVPVEFTEFSGMKLMIFKNKYDIKAMTDIDFEDIFADPQWPWVIVEVNGEEKIALPIDYKAGEKVKISIKKTPDDDSIGFESKTEGIEKAEERIKRALERAFQNKKYEKEVNPSIDEEYYKKDDLQMIEELKMPLYRAEKEMDFESDAKVSFRNHSKKLTPLEESFYREVNTLGKEVLTRNHSKTDCWDIESAGSALKEKLCQCRSCYSLREREGGKKK